MSGTGPPRGETFRADVAARIWVHILCEIPLWEGFPGNAHPVELQFEAAAQTDDIVVQTSVSGLVYIQCKRTAGLSDKATSPLGKAMEQFVAQFQEHPPREGYDWYVLAYSDASAPLLETYEIVGRFRQATPTRENALLNDKEREQFAKLESLINAGWRPMGATPTWIELGQLLRCLRFAEFRIGPEFRSDIDPYRRLDRLLHDPHAHADAVTELREQCITSAGIRSSHNAEGGRSLLRSKGVRLREPPSLNADWARLETRTDAAIADMQEEGQLKWDGHVLRVQRDLLGNLEDELHAASLLLVGAPGDGKSSLLGELAEKMRRDGKRVVLLRADDIGATTMDGVRAELGLSHSFDVVLPSVSDPFPAYLLIDTLEATHTSTERQLAWRKIVSVATRDVVRWRVVATIRESVLEHSPNWKALFGGLPIGTRSSSATARVRHMVLPALTVGEQERLFHSLPAVWDSLQHAPTATRELLATPFNLRLMMEGTTPATFDAATISGRHELLEAYWRTRVMDAAQPFERRSALLEIASKTSLAAITHEQLVKSGVPAAVIDALVHDGVLRRDPASGRVRFSHQLIEEYALSLTLDDDPAALAAFLTRSGDS